MGNPDLQEMDFLKHILLCVSEGSHRASEGSQRASEGSQGASEGSQSTSQGSQDTLKSYEPWEVLCEPPSVLCKLSGVLLPACCLIVHVCTTCLQLVYKLSTTCPHLNHTTLLHRKTPCAQRNSVWLILAHFDVLKNP